MTIYEKLKEELADSFEELATYYFVNIPDTEKGEHYCINVRILDKSSFEAYYSKDEEEITAEEFAKVSGFSVEEVTDYLKLTIRCFEKKSQEELMDLYRLDYDFFEEYDNRDSGDYRHD